MNTRALSVCTALFNLLATLTLRAQVVADGATNTLSNFTNTFTSVTVGTNGSFTLLVLSNNVLLTNSGNGTIGLNLTARSNEVRLVSPTARWQNGNSLFVGSNGPFNRLLVSNGASAFANSSFIGQAPGANSNSATVTGLGSRWQAGNLFVGDNAEANSLVVSNSGLVECFSTEIGRNAGGANNRALITGSGSLLSMLGSVLIGDGGSGNRLVVSNGAAARADLAFIGFSGGNNTALITGSGSAWTNNTLVLGRSGGGNSLIAGNAANVFTTTHAFIGLNLNASLNSAVLTDPNTRWLISSNLYVGSNGALSQLIVSNGALLVNLEGFLGSSSSSTGNTALVTGAGTVWSNLTTLRLGDLGGGNRLTITNGGRVEARFGSLGMAASASSNLAVVTGPGSFWRTQFGLAVGNSSSGNRLVITNGGRVRTSDDSSFIGSSASATNNEVVVTGSGSSWTNESSLFVGGFGSGNRLVVTNGGELHNQGGFGVTLGDSAGSTNNRITIHGGTLRVTSGELDIRRGTNVFNAGLIDVDLLRLTNALGGFEFNGGTLITRGAVISNSLPFIVGVSGTIPALWDVRAGTSNHVLSVPLYVGFNSSSNLLLIANGATVLGSSGEIGARSGSTNNQALVTGAGSMWNNSDLIYIGTSGADNRLIITNGGAVVTRDGYIGGNDFASNNLAVVTGAGSTWTNLGELHVGSRDRGNQLVVSNGALIVSSNGFVGFDASARSNVAIVTGTGSTWSNRFDVTVGENGSANNLIVSNGATLVNGSDGFIGRRAGASSNSVTVTGSWTRWLVSSNLYVGSNGAFSRLVISNGALLRNGIGSIGAFTASSNNVAVVTGPGSVWSNTVTFNFGVSGSGNQLVVSNGGLLHSVGGFLGQNTSSSNNAVVITGAGSFWSIAGSLFVGSSGDGNQLVVTNGGSLRNGSAIIGSGDNEVLVTGDGSTWTNAGTLIVGTSRSRNRLVVSNGGVIYEPSDLRMGENATSTNNRIVVDGGTLIMESPTSGLFDVRRGTNILNAGLIFIGRLLLVTNTLGVFEFNGGTLQTANTTHSNGRAFTIGNGVSAATFQLLGGTHTFADNLIVASNASLIGTGTVTGVLSTQPGGKLSPGVSVGTIVLSNSPSLQGAVVMELSKNGTTLTNDQIQVAAPLTLGGTLIVSNVGPSALAAGDRFTLFSATSFAGTFSTLSLPKPGPGLSWTNKLLFDGSIEVVSWTGPRFTNVTRSGTNLLLSVTDGFPAGAFDLLTATNIITPLTNWITVRSGKFDSFGTATITNGVTFTEPQRYFRILTP